MDTLQSLFKCVLSNHETLFKYIVKASEYEIDEFIKLCKPNDLKKLIVPLIIRNYNLEKFVQIVKKVDVNFGCDADNTEIFNFEGINPLFYSCLNRKGEYIKILVENGADCNYMSNCGRNAIMFSIMAGDTESLLYLHEKGCKLLSTNFFDKEFTTDSIVTILNNLLHKQKNDDYKEKANKYDDLVKKYDDLEKKYDDLQKKMQEKNAMLKEMLNL